MTKVQLDYKLTKPIEDSTMEAISRAHGIYGIIRVALPPSMDKLVVEYDASRLSPLEVEEHLHALGIPVAVDV